MRNLIALGQALVDPTRVRILAALRAGELCVCELADALEISQSTLSGHLQVLRQTDLVAFHERQPTVFCALLALAFALQLVSHASRALYLLHFKQRWVFSAQPLSALLFLGYCALWLLNDSFWPEAGRVLSTGAPAQPTNR